MRCRHVILRFDCPPTSATWGARCGKSARRVLRGGTGTKDLVARPVPTHHRVNHDRLLAAVAERVADKRMRKLIRAFLKAGVMEDGLVSAVDEGTPQGGPLSPLLSNLVLDELDRELERRGHHFVRYADDCNIYVGSERAGQRVMENITRFITRRRAPWLDRGKGSFSDSVSPASENRGGESPPRPSSALRNGSANRRIEPVASA